MGWLLKIAKNLFVTNGLDGLGKLYFRCLVGRHGSDVARRQNCTCGAQNIKMQTGCAPNSRTQCWITWDNTTSLLWKALWPSYATCNTDKQLPVTLAMRNKIVSNFVTFWEEIVICPQFVHSTFPLSVDTNLYTVMFEM